MKHFVFDVDGTLFDTRALVEEAYREAGVVMPNEAWGKPWPWWTDADTHAKKVIAYSRLIRERIVPTLPPCDVARELIKRGERVSVLTAASHDSTRELVNTYLKGAKLLGWSLPASGKLSALMSLTKHADKAVYVDDKKMGETIATAACVHFVWYQGQDYDTLMKDVENAWT